MVTGYRVDPFLKELCYDPRINARRSPAINRGYLARLLALEVTFEKLILMNQVQQVLSLGAGYDSLYFRLANCGYMENLKYYEIDYPKSVHGKNARIMKSKYLLSMFKKKLVTNDSCYVFNDGAFNLIGCSLIELKKLEQKLKECDFDPSKKTLILTECSTTYMENEECRRLFEWLNSFVNSFVIISYEQIRPFDSFGQIMTAHFKKRNSAIKCVQHHPTIEAQENRFKGFGWGPVIVRTIEEIWKKYMNESEMTRLSELELFDEAPELMSKCLHYVLILAVKHFPFENVRLSILGFINIHLCS